MSREDIEQQLVTELRNLETLRHHHLALHPGSQLEREDPDVQRMIEALAVFSVRTRLSLQRNMQATWRRLFASYFDFLLAPLPSCTIAQAVVSPRLVETLTIDRGAQIRVTTTAGNTATFTTLEELRILPITLDSVEHVIKPGHSRLLLRFSSRYPRTDAVDLLRLHIHCAGHYESALAMHYQLRASIQQVWVVYDSTAEPRDGRPCPLRFGSMPEVPLDGDPKNPAQLVQQFFHFPERELYLNVHVPRCEQAWSRFTLCFELGPDYIPEPAPARDTFQLFTVPIENRLRMPAEQITCDGLAAGYAIRHLEPANRFALVRVRGVFRQTERGPVPLRPAALCAADSEESFEIEEQPDEPSAGPRLLTRMPRALLSPVKLLADCEWHQPWFAREAVGKLRLTTPQRSLEGVTLQALTGIRAAIENPMGRNTQGLLLLLALRMKPVLTRDELLLVMEVLGSVAAGPYRRMPALLRELRVEAALDSALRGSGLRHVYWVAIERFAERDEAMVWHFLLQVQRLLDSWNAEATVLLEVDSGDQRLAVALPTEET